MNEKDKQLLEKLQFEHARVEDAIYEYARQTEGLADFHCKWTNKDQSHSDYNLPNMVFEFLDAIKNNKSN